MAESPVKELDELAHLRVELRAAQLRKTHKPVKRSPAGSGPALFSMPLLIVGVVLCLTSAAGAWLAYQLDPTFAASLPLLLSASSFSLSGISMALSAMSLQKSNPKCAARAWGRFSKS
jgi:hypothetical protein